MWRLARLVLTWMLFAALPLQGMAAASMALCGPGTGHAHAAQSSGGDAPHDHGDASDENHHDDAAPSASTDASKACSVCASCCVGAAAVSQPVVFEPSRLPDSFGRPMGSDAAAFVTEGLERPPRTILR